MRIKTVNGKNKHEVYKYYEENVKKKINNPSYRSLVSKTM